MIILTVSPSDLEVVAGIPKYVIMETDIPATVFYTLDGTIPTTSSSVYLGAELFLPTTLSHFTFKAFASNGSDSSEVFSADYGSFREVTQHFAEVLNANEVEVDNRFPFGELGIDHPAQYGSTVGTIVDDETIVGIPDGYDGTGTGTPASETDLPLFDYDLIFSDSNAKGERGHGLGTLPAEVTVLQDPSKYDRTDTTEGAKFFNPKALVIYQDSSIPPVDPNLSSLNKQFFYSENQEKARQGAYFYTTGQEGLQSTGSFVRRYFNAKEQKMIFYYFDSTTGRWIISREAYTPDPEKNNYAKIIFSNRDAGSGFVYRWMPFVGRKLI